MSWLAATLRANPEIALFATLAIGHLVGRLKLGPIRLNPIVGVLLAGLLVGQLGITVPPALQSTLFLLFMFATGYATGPQFLQGLRANGAAQIGVAVFFCAAALVTALLLARLFHFSAGITAGALAGGITQSSAVGTAADTLARLPIDDTLRATVTNEVTIGFAVTYLVGLLTTNFALAWLAPRLMRVDLAAEARKLEEQLGMVAAEVGVFSAYRAFVARAYNVPPSLAGQPVADLEKAFAPNRAFVERIRRTATGDASSSEAASSVIERVQPDTVLQAGDCVALAAHHQVLASGSNPLRSEEVDDPQLLDIPTVEVDVVLTRKDLAGHSLAEVGEIIGHAAAGRGVFVRKITRAGQELPRALRTVLERGDVLTLVGAKVHIEHVASLIGTAEWPGLDTDLGAVAATITVGGLIGLVTLRLRGVEIGLSPAVGVLIGGLVLGWLRSTFPVLYRVPAEGVELLSSLGLTAFLAGVAVNAGPAFVTGLRDSGAVLLASGVLIGGVPHVLTVLFGRYVLRMNPVLLLGITAGAGTAPPALAAVQEIARSKVPSLAYGVSYAVGNVLLTLWGAAIVLMLAT